MNSCRIYSKRFKLFSERMLTEHLYGPRPNCPLWMSRVLYNLTIHGEYLKEVLNNEK